ncbi:MAG: PepSY domain-containing protein [Hyphomicrobiales bacterium]|nr:PepSY domain-containing protein [Hyphomicrobiales bacterium]
MALLHTWGGLLVGWGLFFIFLTGTFGYVNHEIDRWMTPERVSVSTPLAASNLVRSAEDWLAWEARDAQSWYVFLPAGGRSGDVSVGWRTWPEGERRFGSFLRQALDPSTGKPLDKEARETGGGQTLYAMHYRLHYLPYDWAIRIVGVCSMFMLLAIISGVIVHKKIFKDFFTFRPGKGQRSWLDGHNLLSVAALPFHLMITWSGLIFFMFTYVPTAADALYPKGEARDRFYAEVSGDVGISPGVKAPVAETAPLGAMLARAEQEWGRGAVQTIRMESPGREGAQVLMYARQSGVGRGGRTLLFDGATGEVLRAGPQGGTAAGRFQRVMLGLHEGLFADPVLRALYVFAGLSGTAMIATGLLLWSTKRKAKLAESESPHFGIAAIDILNLGTIIGLPIGIAIYFWANRLLPVGMEGRAEWEVHAMFIAWGLAYVVGIWRPVNRAWLELCYLAAAAYGLIPILNAITTDRHLLASIPEGDWVMAGFDLSAFATGLFFLFLVRMIHRKQRCKTADATVMAEAASNAKAA